MIILFLTLRSIVFINYESYNMIHNTFYKCTYYIRRKIYVLDMFRQRNGTRLVLSTQFPGEYLIPSIIHLSYHQLLLL